MYIQLLLPVLLGALCIPAGAQDAEQPFKNQTGWKWLLSPVKLASLDTPLKTQGAVKNVEYSFDLSHAAGLRVKLTIHDKYQRRGIDVEYRGVAFDAAGTRHVISTGTSSGNATQMTANYFLPTTELAPKEAVYAGIEILTPEGRKVLARDAQERARAAGVEVLPLPEIGQPFDFRLTTIEGAVVSSRKVRGKVVLIDGWATWCSPCMAKMPKLRAFYDKHHSEGFEIVGVNFDQKIAKTREAIKKKGLSWKQVYVPPDDATRALWEEAASISTLPRLILIDRAGVVRAECNPGNLEQQINQLLHTEESHDEPVP